MTERAVEASARLISRDDTVWAIGGHWDAGGRMERKPKSWVRLAKEECFPPDRTAYVWSKDLHQVGWFVWEARNQIPKNTSPLALQAVLQVSQAKHPFIAVFNLGDGLWWLFGTDSNGAIHPQWGDFAGTFDEVERHINSSGVAIASSATYERFSTPEESWAWLLADQAEDLPRLRPVYGRLSNPRSVVMLAVTAVVVVALLVGVALYRRHLERTQAEFDAALQARQEAVAERMRKDQAAQEAEWMQRIQAQWQAWPRPWAENNISIKEWLSICRVTSLSSGGWSVQSMKCTSKGDHLYRVKTWRRERFATILTAPRNAGTDADGNAASTTETFALSGFESVPVTLEAADVVALRWLAIKQKVEGLVDIKVGPIQEFRPPFPSDAPAEIQSKMTPPVLYRYLEVEVTSDFPPTGSEPWLSDPSFVVQEVLQNLAGSGNIKFQWKVKGVAYAL